MGKELEELEESLSLAVPAELWSEGRLLYMVLGQALLDLRRLVEQRYGSDASERDPDRKSDNALVWGDFGGPPPADERKPIKPPPFKRQAQKRALAKLEAWFLEPASETALPFSFRWICKQLKLDEDKLRDRVRQCLADQPKALPKPPPKKPLLASARVVRQVRALRKAGVSRDAVAERFGIKDRSYIDKICSGARRKDVA
jgi:hypothetical protein